MRSSDQTRPSDLLFIAARAAEDALPEESREKLRKRDQIDAQRDLNDEVPKELIEATEVAKADPLAATVLQLRNCAWEARIGEPEDSE